MTVSERGIVGAVLVAIVAMVVADLVTDSQAGAEWWHLVAEGGVGLLALSGVVFLVVRGFSLGRDLREVRERSLLHEREAAEWRERARAHLAGLSQAIDTQLSRWNLSPAEKEVAFLLLKGMSLKEIATIRNTSEKTARVQSMAVYSKAGLHGRSELAAFFLEDLLIPRGPNLETP